VAFSQGLGLAPRDYRIGTVENELYMGQQKTLFDREATAALYLQTIMVPGADRCICIPCKNFAAQRGTAFPEKFARLLKELGAGPLKEWELVDYNSTQSVPTNMFFMADGSCLLVNSSRESINALSLRRKAMLIGSQPHSLPEHYPQA
jgi:hypothetical protein